MRVGCYCLATLFSLMLKVHAADNLNVQDGIRKAKTYSSSEGELSERSQSDSQSQNVKTMGISLSRIGYFGIQSLQGSQALQFAYEFDFKLSPQVQVGVAYRTVSKRLGDSINKDYPDYAFGKPVFLADIDGNGVEVFGGFYLDDTFVLRTGLSFFYYENLFYLKNISSSARGGLEVSTINLDLAASSVWTWSNGFTLGVDWVGLTIPLSYWDKKNKALGLSETLQEVEERIIKDYQAFHRNLSFSVLNVQVGMSF